MSLLGNNLILRIRIYHICNIFSLYALINIWRLVPKLIIYNMLIGLWTTQTDINSSAYNLYTWFCIAYSNQGELRNTSGLLWLYYGGIIYSRQLVG